VEESARTSMIFKIRDVSNVIISHFLEGRIWRQEVYLGFVVDNAALGKVLITVFW
jgi:hypothetical protein